MRLEFWIFLIVGAILAFVVYYVKRGSAVAESEKRNLKNLEVELKLEGFLAQYHRLRGSDFEGAYAIHNSSRGKWYFGSSRHVYHEVMEIVSGNTGPRGIYNDIQSDDFFSVRVVELRNTNYRYRDELRRAFERTYGTGKRRYF